MASDHVRVPEDCSATLCDDCQKIDFHQLFYPTSQTYQCKSSPVRVPPEDDTEFRLRSIPAKDLTEDFSSAYSLCCLFQNTVANDISRLWEDEKQELAKSKDWALYSVPVASPGTIPVSNYVRIGVKDMSDWSPPLNNLLVSIPPSESSMLDKINWGRVNRWLADCHKDHVSAYCPKSAQVTVSGIRVIDVSTLRIVQPTTPSLEYVALSYLWGEFSGESLIESSLPSTLPLTIRDTVEVGKTLRYRYLWIDR
ncbi:hypothetical protein P152DRAFT_450518 [Eremomyces bilateralis CBS 781.70]|uniref:Heterokaryon incompatibility domain-containing protein n=1 Tax=Eremomyces bilateralis CBS 781.70 TaxID=1392243 RepID=A0A6G1FZW3_9PEZI|nr:uncharacterized protein P152DRAFT_450518 [Eremomyces bilateralis CBS 781.70]KAF1811397.1 hypothetical protein P152DRAFT_450518 [Eremomyces bilateralis CBS 781.70]